MVTYVTQRFTPGSPKHCVMMVSYPLISQLVSLCFSLLHYPSVLARDISLPQKFVKLAQNQNNLGLFQIRFQYILAHQSKMHWNSMWHKSSFFSFWANLTHFEADQTSLVLTSMASRQLHRWQAIRRCHHSSVKIITPSLPSHPIWSHVSNNTGNTAGGGGGGYQTAVNLFNT